MKVMCIQEGVGTAISKVAVGNIYTIIDTQRGPNAYTNRCGLFYAFDELIHNDFFHEELFAPLSDIDETIIHAEKLETV